MPTNAMENHWNYDVNKFCFCFDRTYITYACICLSLLLVNEHCKWTGIFRELESLESAVYSDLCLVSKCNKKERFSSRKWLLWRLTLTRCHQFKRKTFKLPQVSSITWYSSYENISNQTCNQIDWQSIIKNYYFEMSMLVVL